MESEMSALYWQARSQQVCAFQRLFLMDYFMGNNDMPQERTCSTHTPDKILLLACSTRVVASVHMQLLEAKG